MGEVVNPGRLQQQYCTHMRDLELYFRSGQYFEDAEIADTGSATELYRAFDPFEEVSVLLNKPV